MTPVQEYIFAHKKDYVVSVVLTIIFGPLGLFYSNLVAGIVFTGIFIFFPIVVWILSTLIGLSLVQSHNLKVKAKANLLAKP